LIRLRRWLPQSGLFSNTIATGDISGKGNDDLIVAEPYKEHSSALHGGRTRAFIIAGILVPITREPDLIPDIMILRFGGLKGPENTSTESIRFPISPLSV
jgi:hypothetical protein